MMSSPGESFWIVESLHLKKKKNCISFQDSILNNTKQYNDLLNVSNKKTDWR